MDAKVLEVINQMIILIIYGIVFSREITKSEFDLFNTVFTVGGIMVSTLLMFFIWYLKSKDILE